jgi:hypothetical protein
MRDVEKNIASMNLSSTFNRDPDEVSETESEFLEVEGPDKIDEKTQKQ